MMPGFGRNSPPRNGAGQGTRGGRGAAGGYPVPVGPEHFVETITSLVEAPADRISIVVGNFAPFCAIHGKMIRALPTDGRIVILVVDDYGGPLEFDVRRRIIQESLPDIMGRCEVHPISKESDLDFLEDLSRVPGSSVRQDSAVTVFVPADQVEGARQNLAGSADPSDLVTVEPFPIASEQLDQAEEQAMGSWGDPLALKKILDPHLVSNTKAFDRVVSPVKQESVKVDETLDDVGGEATITDIIQANANLLRKKKGIVVGRKLGSGLEGVAYDIGSGRVMKVTTDRYEAISSNLLKVRGANLPNVVRIFDVFRIGNTPGTQDQVYGIVQEHLTPLSVDEGQRFDHIAAIFTDKSVMQVTYGGNYQQIMDAAKQLIVGLVYKRNGLQPPKAGLTRKGGPERSVTTIPDVGHAKTDLALKKKKVDAFGPTGLAVKSGPNSALTAKAAPHTQQKNREQESVERQLAEFLKEFEDGMRHFQMDKIIPQLRKIGIKFGDFHSGNLMKRGDQYVINDLGRSKSAGQEPPVLEIVEGAFLRELGVPSPGNFGGLGGTQTSLRGGSSGWSSPMDRITADDEEDEVLWQNQLRGMQPVDRRDPDEVPASLRKK